MSISLDAEKAYDISQHPFLISHEECGDTGAIS